MRMDQEKGVHNSGINRRTYLGAVGVATASTSLVGVAGASDDQYDEVVDIVEAGADNTGSEPIDDVFDEVKGDDTLVKFPDGTYAANQLIVYQLSNFAMVAEGDATLVPGDDYAEEQWIAGGETRDLRIEGFTIDNRGDGLAPEIDISAYDGLVVRDIEKIGVQEDGGTAFGLRILDPDGHGLVENVRATDGGYSVGLYIESDGPMTVRNCQFEQFTDNGLYASASSAPIRVEGGRFRNNNITQVRLGSADSVVTGAEIVADERVVGPNQDTCNMRGIRVADGPGPVTVDDCDITMSACRGSGAIVDAYSGGSLTVRDTRIHVDEDYTTNGSDGTRTSYAIFVDDATHAPEGSRTFENVSITGGGRYRSAVLTRRDDNTFQNVCIDQYGEGRNGIIFEESSDNYLGDSAVDVPDEEVVLRDSSVKTANVSYSGSCPKPGSSSSPDVPGEVGTVTHEQTTADEWLTVGFERQYDDPVVVGGPLSYEGYHPAHLRVRDVTAGSFDLQFEEWMYLDGDHRAETVHYLALSPGSYTADGLRVEVGRVGTNHEFSGFEFDRSFDRRPVVFAQTQSYNGSDPVVTRLQNVSTTGGQVLVQEEEGEENGGYHTTESVGYVAVEPGTGLIGDQQFEVGNVDVHEEWHTLEFGDSYADPQFLADIQTFTGPNTANVRYRNLTDSSVELKIQEEQSEDEEMAHRYERVGYAVFEG